MFAKDLYFNTIKIKVKCRHFMEYKICYYRDKLCQKYCRLCNSYTFKEIIYLIRNSLAIHWEILNVSERPFIKEGFSKITQVTYLKSTLAYIISNDT